MTDTYERKAKHVGQALGIVHPDNQCSGQAGALRHGDPRERIPGHPCFLQCGEDDPLDHFYMGPRGEFWNDATEALMDSML